MHKPNFETRDLTAGNAARIAEMFPGAVAGGKINFDLLRALLGDDVAAEDEAYAFTWAGKRAAIAEAGRPIRKTLRPCPQESRGWDTTENLYIEGDNLDVLKLLQESYSGKIKMIYIDPPYNTGNGKFVYPDRFRAGDWCSMMYPRLALARNTLRDDGVIFISIDDNQAHDLRKICDEIFGADNFIGCAGRISKKANNQGDYWAPNFDYLLTYARNIAACPAFFGGINYAAYNQIEDSGPRRGEKYQLVRLYMTSLDPMRGCSNQRYYIECPDGSFIIPPGEVFPEAAEDGACVPPRSGRDKVWRWSRAAYLEKKDSVVVKQGKSSNVVGVDGSPTRWNAFTKTYLNDVISKSTASPNSFIENHINQSASHELKKLGIPFDFAKPSSLVKYLAEVCGVKDGDIVLDFFSGSATTADAVMQRNAEDGGRRKYILVQLPEPVNHAEFSNICEIGKERIRRAGDKVVSDQWLVISKEEKRRYGCTELSGSGRLAKGDGGDQIGLSAGQEAAERGTVFALRSDAAGGGVDTVEHSGGTGAEFYKGIPAFPGDSERLEGGAGNAASPLRESGLPCRYGYKGSDEPSARSGENAGCPHKNTNHCPLTTIHSPDTGFRVLKLDDTNMRDAYYATGDCTQDNVKPDRTDMDLLYGCLLDWGLPLSMKHTHEMIDGFVVHTYNHGDLIACFGERISEQAIREIAGRRPLRAVFRDSGFASSPEKINVFEIFKLLGANTDVKVI